MRRLAVVALALVAAGCGSSGADKTLTIAMVTHSDGGSFWSVVKRGAEQAARDEGVKLIWSPSSNDPKKQARLIDAAVSKKVDGLAVSVPNYAVIKRSLAKARAAGIPIVTLNSGLKQFKQIGAITHVGQSEELAGKGAGAKLKAAGVKKVLCVIHEQSNVGLEQRCRGLKDGFGPAVTTIHVKGTADLSASQAQIASKLQADKSLDAVMTLNPDLAEAAKAAVTDAGSNARVATFDLSPLVIKDIQEGNILFAVDQQQYLQGYLPVVFLKLFKTNANTVGGGLAVNTGPGYVTRSNAATVEKLAAAGTR